MIPYVNKVNAKYVAEKPEESQKLWPRVTEIVDLYKSGQCSCQNESSMDCPWPEEHSASLHNS